MPTPTKSQSNEGGLPTSAAPKGKEYTVSFSKMQRSATNAADSALHGWLRVQKPPAVKDNPEIRIKAAPLTAQALTQLQAIVDSDNGPKTMVELKLTEESFIGILYSALTTHAFVKMQGEYSKKSIGTSIKKEQWTGVVAGIQKTFDIAGLKVTESELNGYAKVLTAKPAAFNAVTRIANSSVIQQAAAAKTATASFVPYTQVLPILTPVVTKLPVCNTTIQGSYTKHFSHTYSWVVNLPYYCGDWLHPFKICWHWVTVASITVNLDLNVGYKIVNCCSAVVWGSAQGQLCAGPYCLTCTAAIVAAASISHTTSGGSCNYALGVQATLVCKVGGSTICSLSFPFGWTVSGPCPPLPC
jgi:hypothetical protein